MKPPHHERNSVLGDVDDIWGGSDGGCPECKRDYPTRYPLHDGYFRAGDWGEDYWFVCDRHKLRWRPGGALQGYFNNLLSLSYNRLVTDAPEENRGPVRIEADRLCQEILREYREIGRPPR